MCLDHGIMVHAYLDDNGVFKANIFVPHIHEHNQHIFYCGVNAHNQNGVDERLILMVSEIARAMMIHSSFFWKNVIGSNLWTMATSYSTYIYNYITNDEYIVPDDLFTGKKFPRHKLKDNQLWSFSFYVFYITLQ